MKEIVVAVPDGKRAEWVNGVLTLVDDVVKATKDERPVMERIKTFEDACDELGDEHPLVKEYWGVVNINLDITQDLISYLKLRIICTALNEGWEPQFSGGEYRWYPWFTLWTKEELTDKTEEWKQEHKLWVWGGPLDDVSACGIACAGSYDAGSNSNAAISALISVKSKELADYFGNQFIDIWAYYVGPFNRKESEE